MAVYVIFDAEIHDMAGYQTYMAGVKPELDKVGAKYLARGGAVKVYEGDWQPQRVVLLEFPSDEAVETFYNSPAYQALKRTRQQYSTARLVSVAGL